MAPPKGTITSRIVSSDFLGINWGKVLWMSPYNNMYPITIGGGHGNRFWTSFIQYGHFANRASRINLRNMVLAVPAVLITVEMFFMLDWYQIVCCSTIPFGLPVPDWAVEKRREELILQSWHKPGAMQKHHLGGQVSIPGSEKLITEM